MRYYANIIIMPKIELITEHARVIIDSIRPTLGFVAKTSFFMVIIASASPVPPSAYPKIASSQASGMPTAPKTIEMMLMVLIVVSYE